jgi:Zn-dependent protease with chaperone function
MNSIKNLLRSLQKMLVRYRDAWNDALRAALAQRRRVWMRGPFRPHIVVLPTRAGRLGAWTFANTIYISRTQLSCPPHVRNYVIGHELGHMVNGDVFIQLLFFLSYLAMIITTGTGSAVNLLGILLSSISLLMLGVPSLALEREINADRVAVQLYGARQVLDGCLWMARRLDEMHSPQRIARLRQLRQYLTDETTGPPSPRRPTAQPGSHT